MLGVMIVRDSPKGNTVYSRVSKAATNIPFSSKEMVYSKGLYIYRLSMCHSWVITGTQTSRQTIFKWLRAIVPIKLEGEKVWGMKYSALYSREI